MKQLRRQFICKKFRINNLRSVFQDRAKCSRTLAACPFERVIKTGKDASGASRLTGLQFCGSSETRLIAGDGDHDCPSTGQTPCATDGLAKDQKGIDKCLIG